MISLIVAIGLLVGGFAHAHGSESLSLPEAIQEIHDGTSILIDVRDMARLNSDSIQGAQWIQLPKTTQDLPRVFDEVAQCLPRGVRVYLFCYVGNFAGFVADSLRSRGLDAVAAGGMHDWIGAGANLQRIYRPALNRECPYSKN